MVLSLLAPSRLADAARRAAAGPYVAGAAVERPWLRLVGFLLLSVAGVIGVMILAGVVLAIVAGAAGVTIDPAMFDLTEIEDPWTVAGEIRVVAMLAVSLGIMAAVILGAACLIYRQRPAAFLWPAQTGGLRLLLIGFLAMMLIMIMLWPLLSFIEPLGPIPVLEARLPVGDRLIYAAATSVGLLIAATAEEVVFRGVALRVVAGLTRHVWVILLINAVVFSAIHLDPDPVAFVARALSGMVWAWAALRLGGLAFAIGAHWANNLFIALLLEPISSAALPSQDIPPLLMGFELVTVLLMLLLIEILARRRGQAAYPLTQPRHPRA